MNPPYGGNEKDNIKQNFLADLRNSKTADLFMILIMYHLKRNGRCAIILPNGFLFGTDNARVAYKNFSKTKPMKKEHFQPAVIWWNDRKEINIDGFDKAKKYTADEIKERNYNIDLCRYPHEEEEILPPMKLIQQYQQKRASLNADICNILNEE